MPWRWGKRLILRKAPRPYRVLCLGDQITSGWMARAPFDNYFGTSYVSLMQSRAGQHYEFVTCTVNASSSLDWIRDDVVWEASGVVEALPAASGKVCDLATILLGMNDAIPFGESVRTPAADYVDAITQVASRLLSEGARKVLILTPIRIEAVQVVMDQFTKLYGEEMRDAESGLPTSVSVLDLYHKLDPAIHYSGAVVHPNQVAHNRLAVVIGRYIRQSMHYRWWGKPGGPGVTTPFVETMDYAEEEDP